jgi:hypothetical protein
VAIAAVVLLLAGAGAVPAVGAVRAPGWRIVAVLRHCGDDSLSSVVATGPRDAWALGQPPWGGGPGCGADVEHWDGAAWRRVPVPGNVFLGGALIDPLTATSASDAWIFPGRMAQIGSSYFGYNYALHWNGAAWHAIPLSAAISNVDAMAQDGHGGIWLAADTGLDLVQYWYHYNGGRWTRQLVPAPRGYNDVVFGMAWIPGTTSVWADGEADANVGVHTVGVIAKYGP